MENNELIKEYLYFRTIKKLRKKDIKKYFKFNEKKKNGK